MSERFHGNIPLTDLRVAYGESTQRNSRFKKAAFRAVGVAAAGVLGVTSFVSTPKNIENVQASNSVEPQTGHSLQLENPLSPDYSRIQNQNSISVSEETPDVLQGRLERLIKINLLPNRSFERPDNPFNPTRPFGWVKGDFRSDLARYVQDVAHIGKKSVAIDIESGPDIFGCRFDAGSLLTEEPVAQSQDEKTWVCFWAKPEVKPGHTNIELHPTMVVNFFKDIAGTVGNGSFIPSPDPILEDNGWFLFMFELSSTNIPPETRSMRLGPAVSGGSAEPGCPEGIVATVWFDDVSARSEIDLPFPPPRGGRIPPTNS